MNGLTYTEIDGILYPDIAIHEMPEPLSKYGMMRKNFLKNHRGITYSSLALQEQLFPHCLEVQKAANERLDLMMEQLTAQNPPPDKETDPMGWVGHMNALKSQAEEVILVELIYS